MSSDQKPPNPPGKSARVSGQNKVSLSELIAQTPGAQTREQLLARIKAREVTHQNKSHQSAPSEEQFSTPEPLPIINKPGHAADFWNRFNAKEEEKRKPPKRSRPRLLIDNDKPDPSDKK